MGSPRVPPFIRHTGIAAPFLRRDVEVEFIAPMHPGLHAHGGHSPASPRPPHRHGSVPGARGGGPAEQHCFQGLRYFPDGRENPDFVLNREPYREAAFLLAGENFGIGSTQSFAVLRLLECGIRAVIAPSFGPVFHEDCLAYGLLPVPLGSAAIARVADRVLAEPRVETTVDLERQVIERPGMEPVPFRMDSRARGRLLRGGDDLEETLRHSEAVRARRDEDRKRRPWIYDTGGRGP